MEQLQGELAKDHPQTALLLTMAEKSFKRERHFVNLASISLCRVRTYHYLRDLLYLGNPAFPDS